MIRGTISEMIPGDYVVIVTVSGEAKRFPMSEVRYAGPEKDQPVAPTATAQPGRTSTDQTDAADGEVAPGAVSRRADEPGSPVTVHSETARVSLRSTPPGQEFHLRRQKTVVGFQLEGGAIIAGPMSKTGYDRVCNAPCEISIPAGTYTFAMSERDGDPVDGDPIALPPGESSVSGEFTSWKGTRIAGWIIFGTGLGAGLLMATVGASRTKDNCSTDPIYGTESCYEEKDPNTTLMAIGALVGITAGGIGLFMGLQSDTADLRVERSGTSSRNPSPGAASRNSASPAGSARRVPTAALVGRF